jgi:predicted NBD/HSP70 family sugar kinase
VQIDGARCRCGKEGCWETVATLSLLREEAERLRLSGASTMNSAAPVALAETGAEAASQLLDTYARNLAIGIANNEQVLVSGSYVIHGDACGGGETMRKAIED